MLKLTLFLLFMFVASWVLVGRFRAYALAKGLLDNPNARSSHTLATPRGGGLVFILLWLVAGVWSLAQALVFLPGALLLAGISYWDDHHDLPAHWRALVHFGVAGGSVMVLGVTDLPLGWLGAGLAVFTMVWSINLFNFMDGTDGIASVEALFVLGVGGFFLWRAGGAALAILFGGSIFACRHCHKLAYDCQRETDDDRAARRADTLRRRLGWEAGILNGDGGKPKGMHWRTFERLKARHDAYVGVSLAGMARRLGLMDRQLSELDLDLDGLSRGG